jgi:hypothetical protein
MAESIQQLTSISPSQPGNIQNVWSKTNGQLYHKLSPYTNDSGLIAWGNEPYNYVFPDKTNAFLNGKYDSFSLPIGSAASDVMRMGRFITSGKGVLFLAKNLLLQTGNAFNETRLYSPTEVLVSAARPATLGLINRPTRHIDISGGGLMGILGSLVGIGSENSNQPSGTVNGPSDDTVFNKSPLSSDGEHISTEYRGLSRAGTANAGLANLNSKWVASTTSGGFFATKLGSLFANFKTATQTGIIYKSSEGTYGSMIKDNLGRLSYINSDGVSLPITQQWVAGDIGIRKTKEYPIKAGRMFVNSSGRPNTILNKDLSSLPDITGVGAIGYDISKNSHSGLSYKYADNMGASNDADYYASDIMVQYSDYVNPKNKYPSKQDDTSWDRLPAKLLNETLKAVLNNINNTSDKLYTINVPTDSRIIGSGQSTDNGYDRLFKTKNKGDVNSGLNYNTGLVNSYRQSNVRTVDENISTPQNSLRLPSSNRGDAINTLTVIPSDSTGLSNLNNTGWWQTNKYNNDQIAFYFYDIVNQNYIPFRATITGISEGGGAEWEPLSFIGRADKVYSYSGFTRTLSFKFHIHINSISELAPTWQRINYLSTLIKPSNYTSDKVAANTAQSRGTGSMSINNITNRFMIPPMVMLNIGDMYREQPVVITQVGISIPEDASWETLNEDNVVADKKTGNKLWSYLANYISATSVNTLYGQFPRSVDISLTMNLLEKEQPVVGGANFGHAPRTSIFAPDDDYQWNTNTPDKSNITEMNKSLVVRN